jgi:demethylmenaquinone methyltransferase / 2-methoxy-6-polyprenyl-1,4-benzoquinol methylase
MSPGAAMPSSKQGRATLPGTRPAGASDEAAAARQVREMFSRIAPRYDFLNHFLSLRFDVLWRRRVARRFRNVLANPDARVLDLCCGTGDLALALAAEVPFGAAAQGARLLAADFAHPMLVRGREKTGKKPHIAIDFIEADVLSLPFADGTFDLVTTAFGFRNLANYTAGLAELHRVTRKGGFVAILEFAEPEGALFGRLFRFYFHRVLPRIGALVSGNAQAYDYLPNSVSRFPRPVELAELMQSAGFADVSFARWTGGIVALHTGQRRSEGQVVPL